MAADAALINSFERLATSGQRDYSGQLQAQREQGRITQKGFTDLAGILSEKSKSEHDVTMEAYKEQNKKTKLDAQQRRAAFDKTGNEQALEYEDGGGLPEEFADEVNRLTRVAGNDFKAANPEKGKDTDELRDLRAAATKKLQDIEKLIVKTRTLYQTETTTSNASPDEVLGRISKVRDIDNHPDVSMEIVDGEAVYTFKSDIKKGQELLKEFREENNIEGEFTNKNIDAFLEYEQKIFKGEKYTMEQLLEEYVPEAIESQTLILSELNSLQALGESKGGTIPPTVMNKKIHSINLELAKDEKILADMAQRPLEGFEVVESENDTGKWDIGSIAYSFQDDPSLNMAVYEAAGITVDGAGPDGIKDGKVSPEEAKFVMDSENRDIIISTIVDPYYINPITGENNYNHNLSSDLVANRILEEGKKKHEIGSAHYQNNLAELKKQKNKAKGNTKGEKTAEDYLKE